MKKYELTNAVVKALESSTINPKALGLNESQVEVIKKGYDKDNHSEHAAIDLSDAINSFNFSKKKFAEQTMKAHRYLQDQMGQTMLETIKLWAKAYKEGSYDPRNKYICKVSNEIVEKLGDLI